MRISVVIPVYNRAHLLPRALCSVAQQTYSPLEVLVVDDGSSDDPQAVQHMWHKAYPDLPLRWLCTCKSRASGVSPARNLGIKAARGDWVALLDSDDRWLPHKLRLQVVQVQHNPRLQIVHGEEIWIRNGVRVNSRKIHRKSGGKIFFSCLPRCVISPSAVLFKKSLLQQVGMFAEDLPVCEDYDLWLRITARYEVGFVEQAIVVKYGGHDDQLSRQYAAIDCYRALALSRLLPTLSCSQQRAAALAELQRKIQIVLRGWIKRGG